MHVLSPFLLSLLPALALAEQVPFMNQAVGWFNKAKSYIPAVTEAEGPLEALSGKIAENQVEKINLRNWQHKLQPKVEGEEEWLVYLTGGNKTCYGKCGRANTAWNVCPSLFRNHNQDSHGLKLIKRARNPSPSYRLYQRVPAPRPFTSPH